MSISIYFAPFHPPLPYCFCDFVGNHIAFNLKVTAILYIFWFRYVSAGMEANIALLQICWIDFATEFASPKDVSSHKL